VDVEVEAQKEDDSEEEGVGQEEASGRAITG
jgi:hypothetical protein